MLHMSIAGRGIAASPRARRSAVAGRRPGRGPPLPPGAVAVSR